MTNKPKTKPNTTAYKYGLVDWHGSEMLGFAMLNPTYATRNDIL